ncbi:hypothetical protein QO206_15130 [Leeuwenhoekiella aequorea]|uniref:hypothetical protein n=1 Tax=Leeuwenhoekiella aequorea TaxID=283736 RepID=UPI00352D6873
MKDFLNFNNLKMGLVFAAGIVVYDYFAQDDIDWIKVLVIALFMVLLNTIYTKRKNNSKTT